MKTLSESFRHKIMMPTKRCPEELWLLWKCHRVRKLGIGKSLEVSCIGMAAFEVTSLVLDSLVGAFSFRFSKCSDVWYMYNDIFYIELQQVRQFMQTFELFVVIHGFKFPANIIFASDTGLSRGVLSSKECDGARNVCMTCVQVVLHGLGSFMKLVLGD